MTREEEIKARLDGDAYWINGVIHIEDAVESIRYLLARNEKLQRRVEKLDKVYERARDLLYDGIYGGEYYDTLLDTVARDRSTGKNTRAVALFDALTPLDGPNGQDDD